ncbi:hypothetical protein GCG54_00014177 [Colletotrichum gloeosporioides]|uniref:Uncharacterized protein n=1 Tax=Colletotrichum gloeosporioides TaxID=474922 RepID=A0A8H4CTU6_COLGL|nr:uncharacterized protein GCG54_00014177 [Colletotrichum gloeosporioides]KAF3809963.1 hypothetical protein GCG54_00014177 [Colletotrichum gloeosporioides]
MSLRQQLTRPLVNDVSDGYQHTHTVVFLHRFKEETTDEELKTKVLSEKLTKNHKTLREQFPNVRFVFPFGKATPRPWNNLSTEDRAAVGMTKSAMPYITQIVLQEAEHVGGLDRVILGGQGETAEAAHEAMSSFPECKSDSADGVAVFIQDKLHSTCTDLSQLRLAGFVGMHTPDGEMTRDVRNKAAMSKAAPGKNKINASLVTNTPHKFINGGYKTQTTTWDGKRIDTFAEFLESIQVYRVPDRKRTSKETLVPKDRKPVERWDPRENLSDAQKYALEIAEQKKENEKLREKILVRIEANKVERKIVQERERRKRGIASNPSKPHDRYTDTANSLGEEPIRPLNRHAGQTSNQFACLGQSLESIDIEEPYTDESSEESSNVDECEQTTHAGKPRVSVSSSEETVTPTPSSKGRSKGRLVSSKAEVKRARQSRKAGQGINWQRRRNGELTAGQMEAFGLSETEDIAEDTDP